MRAVSGSQRCGPRRMVFPSANFVEDRPGRMEKVAARPRTQGMTWAQWTLRGCRGPRWRKSSISAATPSPVTPTWRGCHPPRPSPARCERSALDDEVGFVQPVLEVDLGAPHKQRHDTWMLDWRQIKHAGSLPSRRIGSDIGKPPRTTTHNGRFLHLTG